MASSLAALAVAACVSLGPAFAPAPPPAADRSLVYVYREDTQPGNALGMTVAVDGQEAATLYRRGYSRFYVKTGWRTVSVEMASATRRNYLAQFKGGDTHYFRLRTNRDRPNEMVLVIDSLIPAAGEREVVFYRYQEPARDEL